MHSEDTEAFIVPIRCDTLPSQLSGIAAEQTLCAGAFIDDVTGAGGPKLWQQNLTHRMGPRQANKIHGQLNATEKRYQNTNQ